MAEHEAVLVPEASSGVAPRLLLSILSGPIAFLVVWLVPLAGLNPRAHFGLSAFAWTLAWWVLTPVPWSVTGFLPLVLFPIGGVMSFNATAALYGQRVLPFVLGVMLFGHAFQKHGLARRMAVNILSISGVATSGSRLDPDDSDLVSSRRHLDRHGRHRRHHAPDRHVGGQVCGGGGGR